MDINVLNRSAPRWITLALLPTLLLCAGVSGCQARAPAENQQFQVLFDSFQLMLVDDLQTEMPIEDLNSSTLRNTYPAERALVSARVYMFRKTTATSNEDLAIKVLPKRLVVIGAQVTKAPQSSKDFIYPFIGGPLFVIRFEKGGHHGTMFNRVHTSEQPSQQWEELIVAYK